MILPVWMALLGVLRQFQASHDACCIRARSRLQSLQNPAFLTPSFRACLGRSCCATMNADGGSAALERFCILAKNYKGRGLVETIQQVCGSSLVVRRAWVDRV